MVAVKAAVALSHKRQQWRWYHIRIGGIITAAVVEMTVLVEYNGHYSSDSGSGIIINAIAVAVVV